MGLHTTRTFTQTITTPSSTTTTHGQLPPGKGWPISRYINIVTFIVSLAFGIVEIVSSTKSMRRMWRHLGFARYCDDEKFVFGNALEYGVGWTKAGLVLSYIMYMGTLFFTIWKFIWAQIGYTGFGVWIDDQLKSAPWTARLYMTLLNLWAFVAVHSIPGLLALLVATEYKEMRDCVDLNLLSWQGKKASEAMPFTTCIVFIVGAFLVIMTNMCCNNCCVSTETSNYGGALTVTKSNCWGRSKTWVSPGMGGFQSDTMQEDDKQIVDSSYVGYLNLPLMVWAIVNSAYIMVKVDVPYKITYLGGLAAFFVGELSRLMCG
eukprot:TRINITY_DN3893_c0_g2_i1.p1 TRINITY_DN3893_c0_g2~~TRINITY_DN3893_c0_g2_i1.p1  ORF type:complete len:319 (-),score=40.42 TRINITY_DN3893_c0_g2_i1:76-1032(-)